MKTFVEKVKKAQEITRQALEEGGKVCVGSSMGKDSMVILHLAYSIQPDVPILCVMSDTEFSETEQFTNRISSEWNLNLNLVKFHQENGTTSEECCKENKVEAFRKALKEYDSWIAGIRNTEGASRTEFQYVEEKQGLTKFNPILDFTEMDVWRYLANYEVPVNPAYKKGFRSMGCSICSSPEKSADEEERAGRWRGTGNQGGECGIHIQSLRPLK